MVITNDFLDGLYGSHYFLMMHKRYIYATHALDAKVRDAKYRGYFFLSPGSLETLSPMSLETLSPVSIEIRSPSSLFGFWRQVNLETFTTCLHKKTIEGDLVSIATFLILETN